MLKNFTLLFVEDDELTQEHMKILFKDSVKEFFQAFDGEEGLKIFKNKNPDIVVTDIAMPVLDGLSMAKEIKKIDKEKPIIIISAYDDKKYLLNAINCVGVNNYILKPLDVEMLEYRLNSIAAQLFSKHETRQKEEEKTKELIDLAFYDTLTKIFNRYVFEETLENYLSSEVLFSLFLIDLDDFKGINDTYGHPAGDKVLKTVTDNIKKVIRKSDVFARIGGDEFALVIKETDRDEIEKIAKKILNAVCIVINYEKEDIKIGCSIGIYIHGKKPDTKEKILKKADEAMYKSKKKGKNRYTVFF
ncbi:diguanylate cyclase domain-containing protein [Nautilia sp.]